MEFRSRFVRPLLVAEVGHRDGLDLPRLDIDWFDVTTYSPPTVRCHRPTERAVRVDRHLALFLGKAIDELVR